jgi:hypothetical protein
VHPEAQPPDLVRPLITAGAVYAPAESWSKLDAANVEDWQCPPLTWVVEGMVALENLVIVAAETQTGKTLLGLYLGRIVATGGMLFDKYETALMKVGYFVLEDPVRRVRDRLRDIDSGLGPEAAPLNAGRFMIHAAPQFDLRDHDLIPYLERLIQQEQYKVIVIDTYQRATPGLTSFDDEEQSRILHQLSALTRKYRIAVIVLDHLRKARGKGTKKKITIADIKGTGGKAQNADAVILMEKSGQGMSFWCSTKETDEAINIWLTVSKKGQPGHKFQFKEEQYLSLRPSDSMDQNCKQLLAAIKPGEELARSELLERTGLHISTFGRTIGMLIEKGCVAKNGKAGKWARYLRL